MKSRLFFPLLLLALAIGWYNNGGSQELEAARRVAQFATRPADAELAMPVDGISPRQIANTWQAPRGRTRHHEGQDIFARKGTPVRSATEGLVIHVGPDRLGGNTVSVLGSGGRSYYYAHLDRYATPLRIGQFVEPGELLGYVGNTGDAKGTPPHLHFGVYMPGGAINPLPLLRAAGTRSGSKS